MRIDKLLINRRAGSSTTQGRAYFCTACIHACLACVKNKTDTNPLAAAAYLPDLLAVDLAPRFLPLSSSLVAFRQSETITAWVYPRKIDRRWNQ